MVLWGPPWPLDQDGVEEKGTAESHSPCPLRHLLEPRFPFLNNEWA